MNTKRAGSRDAATPRHCRRTTRFHRSVKMLALLPLLFLTGQLGAQSALDGFDPKADGTVQVVVVQPDGKILIGGDFETLSPNGGPAITRNRIARLNPDGTVDMTFDPNATGGVYAIALQADGKILVGGYFHGTNSIGGQTRNRIARLDPVTGLADSFDPNANESIQAITVQADGKILVGGSFQGTNSIGGQTRNYIARLDPTTGLADSFDPNANWFVRAIVVQADGRILAGGVFTSIGGQTRSFMARLDPTTGLADSFDPSANDTVNSIAIQADGKILVGGRFQGIGGQVRGRIARLNPITGAADSFHPNALNDPGYFPSVVSIVVQADGKILVGGFFTSIGGQARHHIARLDPATGLADSLDPNAEWYITSIAVQADGKILASGFSFNIGGDTRNRIFRMERDGRRDQTLNLNLSIAGDVGSVSATAVQPDGKILIAGYFDTVLGVTRHNIARLNSDGSLDLAFDPNANVGFIDAIAIQPDGKILVGGAFTSIGGQLRNHIARLDPATGAADSFNPDANGSYVHAIAVQADGKILVGGDFNENINPITIGGQTRNWIARLDPATGLADSWDPDAQFIVYAIAVQRDGKILVGGEFDTIGGQTRNRLARLDPTTALADSWDPNASHLVWAIAVQPDNKILVGGVFTLVGQQVRPHIARLDAITGLADSFNPDANQFVTSIAVQADGKILAGGGFTTIGGQNRPSLARLDATTGLADSFDANFSISDNVFSIALQGDGKILVGGNFDSAGGQNRNFFARLSNDTAAQQNLAATQTTIAWTRGGSSPQFDHVSFETSFDNVNYTPLGNATPAGNNWTLTGLSLPIAQNIYLRARGYYGQGNGSGSIAESVRNVFVVQTRLVNLSTRMRVGTGDNAMIGGFIITGTEPKTVIVRGIGPSLPLPGVLSDPIIEVYGSSGQLLGTNDNWNDSLTRQQIIDSGLAPSNDLESALWGTINPGAYTVVVRGVNNTTGIGLFEVYDLDQAVNSKLANISTRGFVETGDNVLIGGMIVIGQNPLRAIVRATGPSLPVPGALEDPILELYDGNGGLITVNYNWRDDQEEEILATGIQPSNDLEAAIVSDFAPGNYTAIVRGLNNTTGMALVEAYDLN